MRIWMLFILCGLSHTGAFADEDSEDKDGGIYSRALSDKCRVSMIGLDEAGELHEIELVCKPGAVTYRLARKVGDQSANWPNASWNDVAFNEETECFTERQYRYSEGGMFFFTYRTLKNCWRLTPKVSVEALPPKE